jgi:hypothetical protein
MKEDHLDLKTQPLHGPGFKKDLELLLGGYYPRFFFTWAGVGMG